MPPLLCLSPSVLDHSFPRTADEIRMAAVALGEIQSLVDQSLASVLSCEAFESIVDSFEWQQDRAEYPLVRELQQMLTHFFLAPDRPVLKLELPKNLHSTPHPIPDGLDSEGLVEYWAIEVGKLYAIHSMHCHDEPPFIGVACDAAFSGRRLRSYADGCVAAFPLVGPEEISELSDAYVSSLPEGIRNISVSFSAAKKNCFLLGAKKVAEPRAGGSHYKVSFAGARPWILDSNHDPVLEQHLRELIDKTQRSLEEIIYVLATGKMPMKRFRLEAYQSCT